jgi:regulator of replication initiation timing
VATLVVVLEVDMGSRTGVIKFNVTERGRRFRGQDRAFDTVALANLINGGSVQERVQQGDMLGYYGHWPRVKFGMNPVEGGIVDGKQVALEPAVRTVYIKAYPDGTIEHEGEFLDTNAGRLAERLYRSKTGGFSSAIDVKSAGSKQIPRDFYGFDYVLEPNFTKNRGYAALDGVSDEAMAVFDEVAEYNDLLESTNRILDQVQADYDMLAETARRLELENIELMSMLVKQGKDKPEVVLDSLTAVVHGSRTSRFDQADQFRSESLAGFEKEAAEEKPDTAADKHLFRRFGV